VLLACLQQANRSACISGTCFLGTNDPRPEYQLRLAAQLPLRQLHQPRPLICKKQLLLSASAGCHRTLLGLVNAHKHSLYPAEGKGEADRFGTKQHGILNNCMVDGEFHVG
jgi:hypothetical protein